MTKPKDYQSGLLPKEVYAEMEGEIKRSVLPPKPVGIEVALLKIMHDRRLHDFIRSYAQVCGIYPFSEGYYIKGYDEDEEGPEKVILLWKGPGKDREVKDLLYIGPDRTKEIPPIFYRTQYYDQCGDEAGYEDHPVIESKGLVYVKYTPYNQEMRRLKIGELPVGKLPPEIILQTLEKSIEKLFRELRMKK